MSVCVCDIGGTNFRMARYENGQLSDIRKFKTPNFFLYREQEIRERIVSRIADEFRAYRAADPGMDRLAVCFPGPVTNEGEPLSSSVIFGDVLKERFCLQEILTKELENVQVRVVNDITAAAYRYMGNGNFCLITVSSGIGNKVCIGDRVILDRSGKCGEIGHFAFDELSHEVDCSCGTGKNHVGMISSGRGVELFAKLLSTDPGYRDLYAASETAKETGGESDKITAELLALCADRGDAYAKAVIDYCTVPLAMEICLLATAMDLPRFILIGGFATNCAYYLRSLKNNVKKRGVYNFTEEELEGMIVMGEADDNHGLIGAGIMMERFPNGSEG